MGIVSRTVERIDDPLPLARSALCLDSRSRSGLFSENCVARIVRLDTFDDQLFGSEIGFSD